MRRSVSIAVLVVLLTAMHAPLGRASASSFPACCRAGGKQRCKMSMGVSGPEGFQSSPETCPYRIHAAVTSELAALTAARHGTGVLVLSSGAPQPTEVTFCVNLSGD